MGPIEKKWLHSRSRRKALAALAGVVAASPLVGSRASAQLDPRPLKDHKRLPGLDEMVTAFDFEPVMFANVPLSIYDYTAHGDGSDSRCAATARRSSGSIWSPGLPLTRRASISPARFSASA